MLRGSPLHTPKRQLELRQLQLQLTDLKFSRRKDEPEDWSPGHWAGDRATEHGIILHACGCIWDELDELMNVM